MVHLFLILIGLNKLKKHLIYKNENYSSIITKKKKKSVYDFVGKQINFWSIK
jgi:hypothetical protein